MKNYIIILLLVLIILLIFSRKKYNTRESFLLKKCLDINNYNGKNNRNCENEIKKTQEIIPVLKYQDYDKYCLINNYKNFYQPKIIGNYKVSLKCEPQLKCACGDNAECMYMKNSDGNINLTKKCKVSSNKMNEMLNSDISKMIKYSKYINKIPEICNRPDLQNGWFYEPGSNLNEIKNIYDENLGINSRCNTANDIIKPTYNKKKNVTLQVNSNIPKPANSVKLNVNTNDNIPKLQPMPIVQEEIQPPVQQPAVQQPAVQQPAIQQPAVKQPAVKQPAVQQPIPQVNNTKWKIVENNNNLVFAYNDIVICGVKPNARNDNKKGGKLFDTIRGDNSPMDTIVAGNQKCNGTILHNKGKWSIVDSNIGLCFCYNGYVMGGVKTLGPKGGKYFSSISKASIDSILNGNNKCSGNVLLNLGNWVIRVSNNGNMIEFCYNGYTQSGVKCCARTDGRKGGKFFVAMPAGININSYVDKYPPNTNINKKVVVPKYIQVSTKNTSLGKILKNYKYPIKTSYYYLSWSGARPNLGNNRKWATWTPNKGNDGQLLVNITPDGYISQKDTNLYLSWSCVKVPNLCPRRRWAVWSPNKDTPVEFTSDGYLKMKSNNLYLSWSGYRRNILGAYRLSAVWSPIKDNPIILSV